MFPSQSQKHSLPVRSDTDLKKCIRTNYSACTQSTTVSGRTARQNINQLLVLSTSNSFISWEKEIQNILHSFINLSDISQLYRRYLKKPTCYQKFFVASEYLILNYQVKFILLYFCHICRLQDVFSKRCHQPDIYYHYY